LPVNLGVMDFAFMGGSMGSVVGEKIARLGQRSLERKYPLIVISASGGARMQEGVLSLMQMAKVSACLAQLAERRIPYISILTNPTTGGVSASYAMLGDAILAEPGAVIGFAGPASSSRRWVRICRGFQTAEFLLDHGMLDSVVHRRNLKRTVSQLLRHMSGRPPRRLGLGVAARVARRTCGADVSRRISRRARLFVRAHDERVQVRPRAHRRAARASRESAREYPATHYRRNEREGQQRRDDFGTAPAKGAESRRTRRPHLVDFRERMIVDGEPIPADDVVEFITRHTPEVEQLGATLLRGDDRDGVRVLRACRLPTSRSSKRDLAERLDSTNVLTPIVAGVTSIGYDHTEYLGSTLEEIAREKGRHLQSGTSGGDRRTRSANSALLAEHAERRARRASRRGGRGSLSMRCALTTAAPSASSSGAVSARR
jgi:hypothetical protein